MLNTWYVASTYHATRLEIGSGFSPPQTKNVHYPKTTVIRFILSCQPRKDRFLTLCTQKQNQNLSHLPPPPNKKHPTKQDQNPCWGQPPRNRSRPWSLTFRTSCRLTCSYRNSACVFSRGFWRDKSYSSTFCLLNERFSILHSTFCMEFWKGAL